MWGKSELKTVYGIGMVVTAWLVTVAAFLGCWGYAIWAFGWIPGLALGWIPALIIAGVAGYAAGLFWPVLLVVLAAFAWLYLSGVI